MGGGMMTQGIFTDFFSIRIPHPAMNFSLKTDLYFYQLLYICQPDYLRRQGIISRHYELVSSFRPLHIP